jgi:hypothetical protein
MEQPLISYVRRRGGQFLGRPLVNVLDFEFKSTEPLGQQIVNRGENREEDETENAHNDRPQKVNGNRSPSEN